MHNAWVACHAASETSDQFREEYLEPKYCDSGLSHVFNRLPNVLPEEDCYNLFIERSKAPHSPELYLDEFPNHDVKINAVRANEPTISINCLGACVEIYTACNNSHECSNLRSSCISVGAINRLKMHVGGDNALY